ncbi:MAG TPA: PKD domain-containing protein [Verrucomicrobiae bacterium]|nr:PKD domain-containing protein [Verrucomicrobiae bacterium]
MRVHLSIAACLIASAFVPLPAARAVLFQSTGDPSFDASAPGGTLSGSGWQYEGSWNVGGGGYVGTPVAPMFFLTAKHVGGTTGGVFTLNGFTYHTVASSDCPNCDLTLWQVAETFPIYAPLYSASGEVGKPCVVFGRGTQRGTNVIVNGVSKGWFWGASDHVLRWGQNTVSGVYTDQTNGAMLQAFFGPNKCDLSDGDSSGGMFIQNGATWQLAGVHHAVDGAFSTDGTANTQFNAALLDMGGLYVEGITNWVFVPQQPFSQPSSFYSTRVSANLGWINGVLNGASPVAPVAGFSAAPNNGPWPLTVTFTDTSTGTLTNRFWDFGDGSTTNTTANILTHAYGGPGTNTVSLTVSGPAGTSSLTLTNYIVIGDEEVPATPEGLAVTFVAADEIDLSWMASTNASDLSFVGYKIFRNGVQIYATGKTNFANTGLAPNSNYCYAVAAYNSQGTASPPSDPVCTNTLATPGSLLGTYNGLIIQTNAPSDASSGRLQLVISKTGTFTAKLTMGGVNSGFRGQFDASGNATNTVTPHGLNQLQVILHLDLEGQTGQITGTVSDGTFTSVLLANRAVFSRTNPCPEAGQYAIVFEPPPGGDTNLPSGTGTATFGVTTTGTGRISGVLADGTKINVSAPVSPYGTWPLYEALYTRKQGACIGWVSFDTNNMLSATVDWYRPQMPKAKTFRSGFSTTITLTGQ